MSKKDAVKKTRGEKEIYYSKDKVLVMWKDGKPVYVASNKFSAEDNEPARRWSRTDKKYVAIDRPAVIDMYNKHMGGVDLLDSMVSLYRIPIRKRKWWFPFYTWALSVSAVNAWRLMQRVKGYDKSYLDFLHNLCIDMLNQHGSEAENRGVKSAVIKEVRFDETNHWMDEYKQRGNCRMCTENGIKNRKAKFKCRKCNVALHLECFNAFHGK